MANTASETGHEGLAEQTTTQLQEAASVAQEKAVDLKEQGKGKLGETLDQRLNQAGEQARKVAQALRGSGEQLREQGGGEQVVELTSGAADRIERLGSHLEQTSGDELLREVEDFARRRPWMIAGIGLVAGLAASRFLKASSERRYSSVQTGGSSRYGYSASALETGGRSADEPLARESYAQNR